jgi:predicted nucleotidyltransferase
MDQSPSSIPRSQIILALHEALEAMPEALAAYLGGSDASGRTDTWSDVDVVVVVEPGAVEAAFDAVHAALEGLSPIAHRWRLADPTWHGNSQ